MNKMIALKDTAWYLLTKLLKTNRDAAASASMHSIRDSKGPVKAAFFETVKVPEVIGQLARTTCEVKHDRFRIERDEDCR